MLLVGPWLVRRLLEGHLGPRALVWTYLTSLTAAVTATLLLLIALFLRYLPHQYLERAGLACRDLADSCQRILPLWANVTFSFFVGGVLLGLGLVAGYILLSQTLCTGRCSAEILRAARSDDPRLPAGFRAPVLVVDDERPLSYCIGFRRSRVVVSTGLLQTLDRDELRAVLAHEEGHVAARDNLIVLLARTLSVTFAFLPGSRLAFARLRRAQELAADEYALRQTGDPLVVASSLQKFARSLFSGPTAGTAVAFAEEGNVAERIRGLLFGQTVVTSKRYLATALLALALLFVGFAGSAIAFSEVTLASKSPVPLEQAACHEGVHQAGDRSHAH